MSYFVFEYDSRDLGYPNPNSEGGQMRQHFFRRLDFQDIRGLGILHSVGIPSVDIARVVANSGQELAQTVHSLFLIWNSWSSQIILKLCSHDNKTQRE